MDKHKKITKPKAPKKPEAKVFIAKKPVSKPSRKPTSKASQKPVKKPSKKPASKASKKTVAKKSEQTRIELKILTPKTMFNSKDIVKTAIQQAGLDETEFKSEFKKLEKLKSSGNESERKAVTKNITALLNQHAHIPAVRQAIKILNKIQADTLTKIELSQRTKDEFDSVFKLLKSDDCKLSDDHPVKTQDDAVLYLIEQFKAQQSAT